MEAYESLKHFLEEEGIEYDEKDNLIFFTYESDSFFAQEDCGFLRIHLMCCPLDKLDNPALDLLKICNLLNILYPLKYYVNTEIGYIMCCIEKEEIDMQELGKMEVDLATFRLRDGCINLLNCIKSILENS